MLPFKSWNLETRTIHESKWKNLHILHVVPGRIKRQPAWLAWRTTQVKLGSSPLEADRCAFFLKVYSSQVYFSQVYFQKVYFQKCICLRCIFQELSQIEELPMSPLAADKSAHFPGRHPHLYHPPLPYSDPILPPWWGNKKKTIGNTEFNFQKSGSISL